MPIREIQVELTNACNASCLMCSHRHMKRPVTHMELDLLAKIVGEAKEYIKDPYLLGICGIGEPLLHPQLDEALRIIRQIPFSLGTNGQALNDRNTDLLVHSRFTDITISLDALTKTVHSKMRPGLNWDTVLSNVLGFFRKLRNVDRFWRQILVQIIPTKENEHEVKDFIDFWHPLTERLPGMRVFVKPMYLWPGLDNPYYPGPKPEKVEKDFVLWGPFENTTFRDTCNLFNDYVGIMSDGTYVPCCMPVEDEFHVGNVKDNTITELYNSPVMVRLRQLQKEKKYSEMPFCSKCL